MVGAELPGDVKIKKSKLRGVASFGMNCSAARARLKRRPRRHHGSCPKMPRWACPFAEYAGLTDTVLDLEITPNRPDCLSMAGLAREVGAMYRSRLERPAGGDGGQASARRLRNRPLTKRSRSRSRTPSAARATRRASSAACKVGPSPDWMVERLAAIGQRSINNIVDVTNYILFLFGQPLHAFDLDKLAERRWSCAHRGARRGKTAST